MFLLQQQTETEPLQRQLSLLKVSLLPALLLLLLLLLLLQWAPLYLV